jgi:CheY-like chemotaxis protein
VGGAPPIRRGRSAADSPFPLEGITVLIAEDDVEARHLLRLVLRGRGAQIVTAGDGLEALRALETSHADIVLVDLMMPGLDGFGLMERLRRDGRWCHLPVVAVTALGGEADYLRTWESHFEGHLTKPVDDSILTDTVLRVLARPRRRLRQDVRGTRLADVCRETERALKAALDALGEPAAPGRAQAAQAIADAVAATREAGRAVLGRVAGDAAPSGVRHLVRGLLSVMTGWSRILQTRRDDEAAVARAVAGIGRNARRLTDVLAKAKEPSPEQ